MSEWKEVSGNNFFKFEEEGDSVEGTFVEVADGNFGKNYVLKTKDGKMAVGGYAALSSKMENVDVGTEVKITYLGEKKSERNPSRSYKDFKVEKR